MSEFYTSRLLSTCFGAWVHFYVSSQQLSRSEDERADHQFSSFAVQAALRRFQSFTSSSSKFQRTRELQHTSLAFKLRRLICLKKGLIALRGWSLIKSSKIVAKEKLAFATHFYLKTVWSDFRRVLTKRLHVRWKARQGARCREDLSEAFGYWRIQHVRMKTTFGGISDTALYETVNSRYQQSFLRYMWRKFKKRLTLDRSYQVHSKLCFQASLGLALIRSLRILSSYKQKKQAGKTELRNWGLQHLRSRFKWVSMALQQRVGERRQGMMVMQKLDCFCVVKAKKRSFACLYLAQERRQRQLQTLSVVQVCALPLLRTRGMTRCLSLWLFFVGGCKLVKRRNKLAAFHHRTGQLKHYWRAYQSTMIRIRGGSRHHYKATFHHSTRLLKTAINLLRGNALTRSSRRYNFYRISIFWKYRGSLHCMRLWSRFVLCRRKKLAALKQARAPRGMDSSRVDDMYTKLHGVLHSDSLPPFRGLSGPPYDWRQLELADTVTKNWRSFVAGQTEGGQNAVEEGEKETGVEWKTGVGPEVEAEGGGGEVKGCRKEETAGAHPVYDEELISLVRAKPRRSILDCGPPLPLRASSTSCGSGDTASSMGASRGSGSTATMTLPVVGGRAAYPQGGKEAEERKQAYMYFTNSHLTDSHPTAGYPIPQAVVRDTPQFVSSKAATAGSSRGSASPKQLLVQDLMEFILEFKDLSFG